LLYVHSFKGDDDDGTHKLLRLPNLKANGLGVPMPGGAVKLFQGQGDRRALIFDGGIKDHTKTEDIELTIEDNNYDVDVDVDTIKETKNFGDGRGTKLVEVTIENDEEELTPTVELRFQNRGEYRISGFSEPVDTRGAERIWRVTLKPEETRKFRFTVTSKRVEDEDE
jgi:hypothetical protein